MRLIITGGLGHIGSGIITKIQTFHQLKEIIVIDNSTSDKINLFFNQKFKLPLKILDEDLVNFKLDKILRNGDVIIHLAAITNATESFQNEKKIFYNNFLTTKKVVDSCKKKKIKCIFVSSTSVYGSSDKVMYEDTQHNIKPQSPYAKCKIKEEKYIFKNLKKNSKNTKFIILRLGTIFGVSLGMRFHTAVNKFCYQAAMNKPLTIWKTAYSQKRPYLDLNDAIDCFRFIIEKNKFNNQVYNLVTNNLSIKQLIGYIKRYKKIKIKLVKNKIMNHLSYEASCKKISDYGFKCNGKLNKQIKLTLKKIRRI